MNTKHTNAQVWKPVTMKIRTFVNSDICNLILIFFMKKISSDFQSSGLGVFIFVKDKGS